MLSESVPESQYSFLQLVAETRRMVEQRKQEVPLGGVRALAGMQRRTYDLHAMLRHDAHLALIPRLRRPNTDNPLDSYKPTLLAKQFETRGAQAIAVAVNYNHYHNSLADLTRIAQASKVPIIRYDLIFDEYQIIEARAAGADAVLLIAGMLDPDTLCNLISITQRNRMTPVVQVQNQEELATAIEFEPQVIAISNRNMHTFEINLDQTALLRPLVPAHMSLLSVNGMHNLDDIIAIAQTPLHGIVMGAELFTDPDNLATLEAIQKPPV